MGIINELKNVKSNKKGLFFLILFRSSNYFASGNLILRIIGMPIRIIYMLFVQWILGIDIPDKTVIGANLNVWHGQGLIIHPACIIGDNVTLRHNTTIGQKNPLELPPVIGNNVDISAHVMIIGNITIGDNVLIGGLTLVNKDVPSNSIVYGNPMKILPKK